MLAVQDTLAEVPLLHQQIQSYQVSAEAFDSFYSDHFKKQLTTMKLNIKTVQLVMKKMIAMRDDIICSAPPTLEVIVEEPLCRK